MAGFDFDYHVVAPLMLVGPWLLGSFFGWLWGRTQRGAAAAVLIGLVLTAAAFAALLLTSPPSAREACGEDECFRILGRWLEGTLVREWPLYTLAAWLGGVWIGSSLRRRRVNLPGQTG